VQAIPRMNYRRYSTYPDRRMAAEAAFGALVARAFGRFLRKRIFPPMEELAALSPRVFVNTGELLEHVPWFPTGRLDQLETEYAELQSELEPRYETHSLSFPQIWAVEKGTSFLLYALVRELRPSVVFESGVANGHSSFFMLRALKANGGGKLHSFDIEPKAGSLLSDVEREFWDFHLIDRTDSPRSFAQYLDGLPKADIAFHDADHGYLAQFAEFGRYWEKLNEGGILVGDDIDASYAWIDFCGSLGRQPEMLVDGRKAIGLLHRSAAAPAAG
jgi:predicted O-methyltransferase YrrM